MAKATRILSTVCLALAFLLGVTAQLVPPNMAAAQATAGTDMAGGRAGPQPPCTGHMPNCLDHGGCIAVSALPASPSALPVPVEWSSLQYDFMSQALAGISVEPELTPPILAA